MYKIKHEHLRGLCKYMHMSINVAKTRKDNRTYMLARNSCGLSYEVLMAWNVLPIYQYQVGPYQIWQSLNNINIKHMENCKIVIIDLVCF